MRGKAKNYAVRLPDGTLAKPHCEPRMLADGTLKEYWYAWRGPPRGPRLIGEKGSPTWIDGLIVAHAAINNPTLKAADSLTLAGLSREWQMSPRWISRAGAARGRNKILSKRTKFDYCIHLTKIEKEFGTIPIRDFSIDHIAESIRAGIWRWRDELAKSSLRQADAAMTVFGALFRFGMGRYPHLIKSNPCRAREEVPRLHDATRRERIWEEWQVAAFLAQARYQHLHLPLMMGLWTGQREGDVLRAKWSDYDGETLKIEQQKTGVKVPIYIADPRNGLKPALDAELERRKTGAVVPLNLNDTTICVNSKNEPWKESERSGQFHSFIAAFTRAMRSASITGVAFCDLRGTLVTRLARAGCTIEEIAEITGHKRAEISTILETHYLKPDPEAGRRAMSKLAAMYGNKK